MKKFEQIVEGIFEKADAFSEKAGDFIDDFIDRSSEKLEAVKETAAVVIELEEARQAEKLAFEQLGRSLYDYRAKSPAITSFTPFEMQLRDVARIVERRKTLEEMILETKGMEKCSECGTEVPTGTKFCPECGNSFYETEKDEVADDTTFCPNCGAPVSDEQKYCRRCGTRI